MECESNAIPHELTQALRWLVWFCRGESLGQGVMLMADLKPSDQASLPEVFETLLAWATLAGGNE